jgi:hypothetical protein
MFQQKYDFFIIGALNRYNVFETVPLTGSITYAELAKKCNLPESRLQRWIRHAISKRIFWAPSQDSVAHTITSAELARDNAAWAWVGHNVEEMGQAAAKIMEQNDRYGNSTSPAETAVALANFEGTATGLFDWFENDGVGELKTGDGKIDKSDRTKGWRARRFGNCLKFLTSGGGYASSHIHGFDWDALGEATVVDVRQKPKTISGNADSRHRWVGLVDILPSSLLRNNPILGSLSRISPFSRRNSKTISLKVSDLGYRFKHMTS